MGKKKKTIHPHPASDQVDKSLKVAEPTSDWELLNTLWFCDTSAQVMVCLALCTCRPPTFTATAYGLRLKHGHDTYHKQISVWCTTSGMIQLQDCTVMQGSALWESRITLPGTEVSNIPVWRLTVLEPSEVLDPLPEASVFLQPSCLQMLSTARVCWRIGSKLQFV